MADTLTRPPEAVTATESSTIASVNEPSGSLADFLQGGGTAGASPTSLVASTSGIVFSYPHLAHAQEGCDMVAALRASAVLDVQLMAVEGVQL